MKNLKKVLALVLVVASLMGLATMASATTSEDYSDGDSISHVEAVDVMSTIGVFDGISGAFSGDSILTREQAAKIITYMILGKEDADALVASVAPYTDVSRDRWSAGSIAYCKNEGILAGVGNGRFEPDGKLTGVAFAKMCLVALGYDPEVEILTGPQWAVNTSKLAIASAGITEELSQVSLADEMSREDACQMAFNTIKADLVEYSDRGMNITIPDGSGKDIVISDSASKAKPITLETSRVNDYNQYARIKDETEDIRNGAGEYKMVLQFGEKYFTKLVQDRKATDAFGRPSNKWTFKSEEIGTYIRNSELVQSWTAKAPKNEMYNAIGSSLADDLRDGHFKKNTNNYTASFTFKVDGYEVAKDTAVYAQEIFDKKSSAAAGVAVDKNNNEHIGISGNGVLTELYKDDEGNVTVVMVNTYLVQASSDYNATNGRVNIDAMDIDTGKCGDTLTKHHDKTANNTAFMPTYISTDDFEEADISGIKEGDYLLVTVRVDDNKPTSAKGSIKSITPATIQTGTVTEYTERDDVTMGGTKYSYNRILGDEEKNETFVINSEATLVLDTYGYIMYVDDASSSNSFVYIDDFGSTNGLKSDAVADAYFADGTNDVIDVTKVVEHETKNGTVTTKSVTKKSDIAVYGLKDVNNQVKNGVEGHLRTRWYVYSGSKNGDYTLRDPSEKRYSTTYYFALAENSTALKNTKLIKNGAVNVTENMPSTFEMYKIDRDTNAIKTKSDGTPDTSKVKLRADNKTIFVVKDKNEEVASYTGVENVPDVTLSGNGSGTVKIAWVNESDNKNDSGYARFVFVDVSADTDSDVEGGSSIADYMFVVKATNQETFVDGLSYYKYIVLIDGKEEERWIATREDVEVGTLYYNVKEDGNGRINHVKASENEQRRTKIPLTGATNDKLNKGSIKHSSGVMTLCYDINKDVELVVGDKRVVNLVLGKGKIADLKDDDDNDYEYMLDRTGSNIANFLKDYSLDGSVFYVYKETDSREIETVWVYVNDAKYKG